MTETKNTKKTTQPKTNATTKPKPKTTSPKTKKPTLGKGLDQIFGGDVQKIIDNISNAKVETISSEIPLNKLISNPYQPRKNFDEEELSELAQSIKENGLFTPILVKKTQANKYYIVAGERRSKASRLAGLEKIPAIVANITDAEMQNIALVENVQRSDLNPIEIAISVKEMMKSQNLSQEEVSRIIGKSRSYVANLIGLLKLDKKIINGVLDGKITFGHARPLITLTKDDAISIYNKILEQNLTVRDVEGYVNAYKLREAKKNKGPVPKLKKTVEILYAEELLRNKVKSKVEITNNEIKIKFKGKDQLNRILERIDALEK